MDQVTCISVHHCSQYLQLVRMDFLYGEPLEKTMAKVMYWKEEIRKTAVTR